MPGDFTTQVALLKNHAGGSSPGTGAGQFRAGYSGSKTYGTVYYSIPRMKNQGGAFATGSNALIWGTTSPISGSYDKRVPLTFGAYNTDGYTDLDVQSASTFFMGTADDSSKYGGKYVHLYIAFGSSGASSQAGVLELSKIRYCVQSIANRKELPGA
jgi:hypothetical protein